MTMLKAHPLRRGRDALTGALHAKSVRRPRTRAGITGVDRRRSRVRRFAHRCAAELSSPIAASWRSGMLRLDRARSCEEFRLPEEKTAPASMYRLADRLEIRRSSCVRGSTRRQTFPKGALRIQQAKRALYNPPVRWLRRDLPPGRRGGRRTATACIRRD